MTTPNPPISLNLVGIEELRKRSGWFLGIGILLIVLGVVALSSSLVTTVTLATMVLFGWIMLVAGTMEAIHAFTIKNWGGFFVDLLSGILYLVFGFMVVANPGTTAVALTLLIAVFLIFSGVFRIATAIIVRFPNWGWLLLHGVINLMLGIAIWRRWPISGLWVIGMFVGIDMLFNGWALVMLGLAAKKIPANEA